MTGYKLFRVRSNGTLGSLFIGAKARLPIGQWLEAKCIPTVGFAVREGWHVALSPALPHLSRRGRALYRVKVRGVLGRYRRPESQGGLWVTARWLWIEKLA